MSKGSRRAALCFRKFGRGERIRTSDPLVPNQVLYQAEPLPEHVGKLRRKAWFAPASQLPECNRAQTGSGTA